MDSKIGRQINVKLTDHWLQTDKLTCTVIRHNIETNELIVVNHKNHNLLPIFYLRIAEFEYKGSIGYVYEGTHIAQRPSYNIKDALFVDDKTLHMDIVDKFNSKYEVLKDVIEPSEFMQTYTDYKQSLRVVKKLTKR